MHDLDTCEVTVEGDELNPEQEGLEVDMARLQHKGIEMSSSDLGVIFTGERKLPLFPRPLPARMWRGSPRRRGRRVSATHLLPGRTRRCGRCLTSCQVCGDIPARGHNAATHFAFAPSVGKPLANLGAWLQPPLPLALPMCPPSATITFTPTGVDTMASYEEVLHLLRYRNWHSRSLLDRKFKLICSELNGRYVSNEFQVEVSARPHARP